MKAKLIIFTLLFVSISCFGKRIYTIPKSDFINQFSDSLKSYKVSCYNQSGKKVWLSINLNTQLTINMNDDKKFILLLKTINYENGNINAIEYNIWLPRKKISVFKIDNVKSITIERNFQEYEFPYFNLDSISKLTKIKNDSLKNNYLSGKEYVIKLIKKIKTNNDTLTIRQDACYHIVFKDNNSIEYGVIEKITKDSIYITNSFNKNMAQGTKKEYKICKYLISDIVQLNLLKSGGFKYNNIKIDEFEILIKNVNKKELYSPIWYAIDPTNGEINLYRSWLRNKGYVGITESKGNAIWYEGESTQ